MKKTLHTVFNKFSFLFVVHFFSAMVFLWWMQSLHPLYLSLKHLNIPSVFEVHIVIFCFSLPALILMSWLEKKKNFRWVSVTAALGTVAIFSIWLVFFGQQHWPSL
jgi:hypothetical protein